MKTFLYRVTWRPDLGLGALGRPISRHAIVVEETRAAADARLLSLSSEATFELRGALNRTQLAQDENYELEVEEIDPARPRCIPLFSYL